MTTANDWSPQWSVGGLTFNTYDDDLVVSSQQWFASLDGWEAAPHRVVSMPNISDDGDEPVSMTLGPRQLTVRGFVSVRGGGTTGSVDFELFGARDRLMKVLNALRPEALGLLVAKTIPFTVGQQGWVHSSEDALQWDRVACDDPDRFGMARFQFGLVVPAGALEAQSATNTTLGSGLTTPEPTLDGSNTGGNLAAAVYGYRVSAVNAAGESLASETRAVSLSPLSTPGKPALSVGVGGQLNTGIYSYRVAAVNDFGTTLASQEALIAFGTSGNVATVTVAWAPVAGATGYNVYGRAWGGALQKINTTPVVGTSFMDTGALTPSGAVPASNTTGTTTGSVTIVWSAVPNATGYNVYGRTANAEQKLTPSPITATSYTDTGAATPSGALPPGGFATTITNQGSWFAPMVLTVTGATTNPVSLTVGKRTVTVEVAVPAGQQLVLDTEARTVTLNGVSRPDLVSNTSQWPELAPGANSVFYAGGGAASLAHRAAFA